MANTADFKNGLCIEFNNQLYTIISFQHVKPGKGAAFVRTKLKNITTGRVIENTFNSGVKINTARIEKKLHQFLYKDADLYHFMDTESFEQIAISVDKINTPQFLKENQLVELMFHVESSTILGCELPPFVELKVIYTEPGFKGNTANKALKPAKLQTQVDIQVPLFIQNDDMIKVDTRTGTYVERINK